MKKLSPYKKKILDLYFICKDCAVVLKNEKYKLLIYDNYPEIEAIPVTRLADIWIECGDIIRYDKKTNEYDIELLIWKLEEYFKQEGVFYTIPEQSA
jgi:hypothetical protein